MSTEISIKKENFTIIKQEWIKQSGLTEASFNKEISFALQVLSANPFLKTCTHDSIIRAVLNVAQTGLSLNPTLRYAYLVPRYNSKTKQREAVLDPGYQGLAKLLTDSGSVKNISCQVIHEGDEIEIDLASEGKVKKHTPNFLCGKPKSKNIIAVYSLATLPDGSKHIELMTGEEIGEIRERSESYKAFKAKKTDSCIWESDYPEMCRKTVIKRHFKYLPKTDNIDRLQKAFEVENEANGYKVSDAQLSYIETLLHNSTISEDRKQAIENEMFEYDSLQAGNCIQYLQENQMESLNQQLDRKLK